MNNTTLKTGDFAKSGNLAGVVVAVNTDTVTIEMTNDRLVKVAADTCQPITGMNYLNFLFTK